MPSHAFSCPWCSCWGPHPPPWRSRFDDPYDAEIAFADAQLARLLGIVERRGLDDGLVVAGTEGGSSPAFSPDGRQLAFFASNSCRSSSARSSNPWSTKCRWR